MQSSGKTSDPVAQLRHALESDAFAVFAQPIGAIGATMSYPMAEVLVRLHEEEKHLVCVHDAVSELSKQEMRESFVEQP